MQVHRGENKIHSIQKKTVKLSWSCDLYMSVPVKKDFEVLTFVVGKAIQQKAAEMLETTWQKIPFAEPAEATVGIFATEIPPCGCRRSVTLEMKTGHAWETARPLMRGKKCWATAVLAGALTAELSLGSLAAVFAIFIPSKQEQSVLYIQGNSYVIHVGWTMHYRHCTDSSFHMSKKGNERNATWVFTDINCLPHPLLAAHNVIAQFMPVVLHFMAGLIHRIKWWWNVRDAADCIQDLFWSLQHSVLC